MAQLFPIKTQLELKKVISIIILVLTLIGGCIFYFQFLTGPVNSDSPQLAVVDIPSGSNVSEIAESLKEAGLIREPSYFILLSRFKGVDSKLKAGYYVFSTGMNLEQIINRIIAGEVSTFKLTIPEGLTVYEMALLVDQKTDISAQDFINAAREYELEFMPEQDVEFQVEGFLFPDTYQLPLNISGKDLITVMVNRFKEVVGVESAQVRERSLSIWEIITIASLIEEEAKIDGDRPMISGVIYNRLEERMNLQLCASVLYVLGIKKDRLSAADTKVESPYNTYLFPGLPPGPISNPGLKAIQAAKKPEDVPYLFYFAMPDGTTYYSRTYKEHLEAVDKYLN